MKALFYRNNRLFALISVIVCSLFLQACSDGRGAAESRTQTEASSLKGAHVLVFTKDHGLSQEELTAARTALEALARKQNFTLIVADDDSIFADAELRRFNAVVFLYASGSALNEQQQIALERYVQAGGGFVKLGGKDSYRRKSDWFWYEKLFSELVVDEASAIKPQQLSHKDYDGGRVCLIASANPSEHFSDQVFIELIYDGLRHVMGINYAGSATPSLNYSRSRPENNRFIKKTLVEGLDEPVKFDFIPNGDVLIALRPGVLIRLEYKTGKTFPAGKLDVAYHGYQEWGLLGVAVDPDFSRNQWVYLAYNTKDDTGLFYQQLSRFQWRDNQIDVSSEQELLKYPIDDNCCHTGGDLHFGHNGELFFSTGDNTNPHDQEGYAPVDFRPDMKKNDGLRAPGNTRDLRGKILRIKPRPDGGYDIPEGNLFADASAGRPEIYVMGARNPYTISFDKQTSTLFFGDIGPDAGGDSDVKGARGYDEINRVTAPGNFGWPLVIGKNRPYKMFDYVTQTAGDTVNLERPLNTSPRNTGAKDLPPAQPAFIAYPYGISDEFPELGTGGRSALVAGVYRSEAYPLAPNRYPTYYDNKLFIADFMRAWVKVVSFDDEGTIHKIEPFAPQIDYALPIAARFSPDGTLYVLEYGSSWFTGNPDSRLARLEYVGAGNRPPIAEISLNKSRAGLPAQLHASAENSRDLDGDLISFRWTLTCVLPMCAEQDLGSALEVTPPFKRAGVYKLILEVTDVHGAITKTEQELHIGNEPASIELHSDQNKSFFWRDTREFSYALKIVDREDGVITDPTHHNPRVQWASSLSAPGDNQGHQQASLDDQAQVIMDANNCLACHKVDEKSVGPALREIAARYKEDGKAMDYLKHKIANGGNGVWGAMNMPGFSGLSDADRHILVSHILSLSDQKQTASLPLKGTLTLDKHADLADLLNDGKPFSSSSSLAYILSVSYADKPANGMSSISAQREFRLVPHRFSFESVFDENTASRTIKRSSFNEIKTIQLPAAPEWQGFYLGNFDLAHIKALRIGAVLYREPVDWLVEIRRGGAKGEIITRGLISANGSGIYSRSVIGVTPEQGETQLYIQFRPSKNVETELALLDVSFEK